MPEQGFNNLHLTFLLPFVWEGEDFHRKLLCNKYWKLVPPPHESLAPDIHDADKKKRLWFNERQYFYPSVRAALYYDGDDVESVVREYAYRAGEAGTYAIRKNGDDAHKLDCELSLNSIRLKLYHEKTGKVGILSYSLRYPDHDVDPETAIKICEYGRRVYLSHIQADGIRPDHCADTLKISYTKADNPICEDFAQALDFSSHVNYLSKTVMDILGEKFICGQGVPPEEKISITPVIDDRMFVAVLYKSQTLVDGLRDGYGTGATFKAFFDDIEAGHEQPLDTWYKLVFVDAGMPTLLDKRVRLDTIKKHSYTRWIGYGTIYGFTDYSYVTLSTEDMPAYLVDHYNTMYMQMITLTLAQRSHLIHYSNRLAALSKMLAKPENKSKACVEITDLQASYIRFLSQIYHEEATAQEQGIDMYARLQEALSVPAYIKAVENHLDKLNGLASGFINQKTEMLLSLVAAASLLGGGFQVLSAADWFKCLATSITGSVISLGGVAAFIWFLHLYFKNRK